MNHDGKRVSKRMTEQNVLAALEPGWTLIGINWKKCKIHVVDGFGNKRIISLPL